MSYRRPLCRWIALAVAPVLLAGCAGKGVVYSVPWIRKDFRRDEPPVARAPIAKAYYWVSDTGQVSIALARDSASLLGKAHAGSWALSLVLPDLPAGREKLYDIGRREAQMVESFGGDHRRARSIHGVVVLERPVDGRIAGRFHLLLRQQHFAVLSGWTPPINRAPVVVVAGRFDAEEDAVQGTRLFARTEADGFERPPAQNPDAGPIRWIRPPHSQPARTRPSP